LVSGQFDFLSATLENEQIVIKRSYDYYHSSLINHFYEYNYYAFQLIARYTDPLTELFSTGTTALIIEFHHDL
jgi:hypothetical protein